MSSPSYVVDEIFTPAARPGPLVVGRAEGMEIEPGMQLALEDAQGRAAVRVISVEFATPAHRPRARRRW